MNIVFNVGARHFIVMLQNVPAIPEQVGFTGYYEATCEIVLADGQTSLCECVLQRPRDRCNVVGTLLKDCLTIALVTGLTGEQLTYAAIGILESCAMTPPAKRERRPRHCFVSIVTGRPGARPGAGRP